MTVFRPVPVADKTLDEIQKRTKDNFDQLEDARRGLIAMPVVSKPQSFQISEQTQVVYTGPGGDTFTLPKAALRGATRGQLLLVVNASALLGWLTLSAAGTETVNGVKSIAVAPGQSAICYSDGVSAWQAMARDEARGYDSYQHAGGSGLTSWNIAACTNATALVTAAPTANVLRAFPFQAPSRGGTLIGIGFEVTTLLAGNGRAIVYANTRDDNVYPGALVVDGGSISTGATGAKTTVVSKKLIPGQRYWLAYVSDAAATLRSLSLAQMPPLGIPATFGAAPNVGISVAFTFAAAPDPFPSGGAYINAAANCPALFWQMGA